MKNLETAMEIARVFHGLYNERGGLIGISSCNGMPEVHLTHEYFGKCFDKAEAIERNSKHYEFAVCRDEVRVIALASYLEVQRDMPEAYIEMVNGLEGIGKEAST